MSNVKISIIAAITENRVIGKDNKLLWHIPEDMARFKKLTKGHVVIMGRKTFESIGKPLPNRINIVITKDKNYPSKMVFPFKNSGTIQMAQTIEDAFKTAKYQIAKRNLPNEIFIIGGGQIYNQVIKYADKLYLTVVKGDYDGDTLFPNYAIFKKTIYKEEVNSKKYRFTFYELTK